jgi:hypothetical protein
MSRDLMNADKALTSALSQERWVENAAEIFQWMDIVTLRAIVALGEDEFIRNCRAGFHAQGFTTEDYRTMWHRIRFRVNKAEKVTPPGGGVLLHG